MSARTPLYMNVRDVWMVERGEHFGFALKPREAIRIRRHGLGQNLEGDLPFQVRVGRLVDLAHTPHADLGSDFIWAEAGAWQKSHVDDRRDYTKGGGQAGQM